MIAKLFAYHAATDSLLNRMDPRIKLACILSLLLTITAVTTISSLLYPAVFLVFLTFLARSPWRSTLGQLIIILPFMVMLGILFLVSFRFQNGSFSLTLFFAHPMGITFRLILAKSTLALLLIRLLIQTTSLYELLWAMRRFKVPRIITTLSNLVYAYIHILHSETQRIIRARNSRTMSRNQHSLQNVAHISASVFLRSFVRADQLYKAMLARGFAGEYPDIRTRKLKTPDLLALLACLSVIMVTLWNR